MQSVGVSDPDAIQVQDKFTFLMPYFNLIWSCPLQAAVSSSLPSPSAVLYLHALAQLSDHYLFHHALQLRQFLTLRRCGCHLAKRSSGLCRHISVERLCIFCQVMIAFTILSSTVAGKERRQLTRKFRTSAFPQGQEDPAGSHESQGRTAEDGSGALEAWALKHFRTSVR